MTLADLTEPTTQAAASIGLLPTLIATAIVACGAILIVWLLRSIRPASLRVPGSAKGTPVERWHAGSGQAAGLERLLNDAETVTRLATQAMDERIQRLESLIALADERLAELEARTRASASGDDSVIRAPEVRVRPIEQPRDSVMEEMYRLADQGRTAVEIARELEEHAGKVELILALRTSRQGQRPQGLSAPKAGNAASV